MCTSASRRSEAGFDIFENNFGNVLVTPHTQGEHIRIEGIVYDGSGTPMRDVLMEIWQANAEGHYNHPADPNRQVRGRELPRLGPRRQRLRDRALCLRDDQARQRTGRTGRAMAPHVNLWIVARGINIGLHTRMYFSDEAEANAKDPVLT